MLLLQHTQPHRACFICRIQNVYVQALLVYNACKNVSVATLKQNVQTVKWDIGLASNQSGGRKFPIFHWLSACPQSIGEGNMEWLLAMLRQEKAVEETEPVMKPSMKSVFSVYLFLLQPAYVDILPPFSVYFLLGKALHFLIKKATHTQLTTFGQSWRASTSSGGCILWHEMTLSHLKKRLPFLCKCRRRRGAVSDIDWQSLRMCEYKSKLNQGGRSQHAAPTFYLPVVLQDGLLSYLDTLLLT